MEEQKVILKIETMRLTCLAAPAQWEGRDIEGRDIYIRYRHGKLRVDVNGETFFSLDYGGMYDGVMDFEELKEIVKDKVIFTEPENEEDRGKYPINTRDQDLILKSG